MKFVQRIILFLTHGEQLDEFIKAQKEAKERQRLDEIKDNLNLCFRHQQRSMGTYHSEHNCHYCELENQNIKLISELEGKQ